MSEKAPRSRAVIELEDVALRYRLAKHRTHSFKEYAVHFLRGALQYESFWALSEVDLRIDAGEAVGIIGRNGAGKSTLLRVIGGILKPTRGRASICGSVTPVMALGAGFDYELSGEENIFLNALLLGRQREEIDDKLGEIVEFSGLGDFVHSPLRNYSTGMVARLGFAIATAWKPDILLLDEVLAVGDARFVQRCRNRLEEFREAGVSLVFVSHSRDDIERQCSRCVWLDAGRVMADGVPLEVLEQYDPAAVS